MGAVPLKARIEVTEALGSYRDLPMEFTVSLEWEESGPEDVVIRYAGAGASRVVYTSCDPHSPYASKFASLSYAYDDNAL